MYVDSVGGRGSECINARVGVRTDKGLCHTTSLGTGADPLRDHQMYASSDQQHFILVKEMDVSGESLQKTLGAIRASPLEPLSAGAGVDVGAPAADRSPYYGRTDFDVESPAARKRAERLSRAAEGAGSRLPSSSKTGMFSEDSESSASPSPDTREREGGGSRSKEESEQEQLSTMPLSRKERYGHTQQQPSGTGTTTTGGPLGSAPLGWSEAVHDSSTTTSGAAGVRAQQHSRSSPRETPRLDTARAKSSEQRRATSLDGGGQSSSGEHGGGLLGEQRETRKGSGSGLDASPVARKDKVEPSSREREQRREVDGREDALQDQYEVQREVRAGAAPRGSETEPGARGSDDLQTGSLGGSQKGSFRASSCVVPAVLQYTERRTIFFVNS